ncbi:hypothetical protein, partial [Trinickia sp.]|uniref:hypothetical protein n=1 Tax=Trinickia sp. TaxID=2571163 RepID=UPI003F7FB305
VLLFEVGNNVDFLKMVSFAGIFSFCRPGSKGPAHVAWGLERLRLHAQPGSRLCDRVLSWAPVF